MRLFFFFAMVFSFSVQVSVWKWQFPHHICKSHLAPKQIIRIPNSSFFKGMDSCKSSIYLHTWKDFEDYWDMQQLRNYLRFWNQTFSRKYHLDIDHLHSSASWQCGSKVIFHQWVAVGLQLSLKTLQCLKTTFFLLPFKICLVFNYFCV